MSEQEDTTATNPDATQSASPSGNTDPETDENEGSGKFGDKQAKFTFNDTEITEDQLIEVMKDCYDPEIPVNLYDLGLIHEVRASGEKVEIDMTLTAPGCGFGPQIAKNVEARLLEEDEVDEAFVEIVHDPPWDRSMVSEEGQAQLNMLGF